MFVLELPLSTGARRRAMYQRAAIRRAYPKTGFVLARGSSARTLCAGLGDLCAFTFSPGTSNYKTPAILYTIHVVHVHMWIFTRSAQRARIIS